MGNDCRRNGRSLCSWIESEGGVGMDLLLSVGDADELRALRDWLGREPELRGRTKLVTAVPAPEEMGGVTDILMVAAGSGGALAVFASSLRVYFAQPRRADVTVVIETPDGRKISVDAKRVARPEELVREILGNEGGQ